ncbi:hypothetical protein HBB16_16260 [Pseudonocardia sp. MCCB 268]|nr:hypothetical protein [Pseudonocardia cytotoxica]
MIEGGVSPLLTGGPPVRLTGLPAGPAGPAPRRRRPRVSPAPPVPASPARRRPGASAYPSALR